MLKSPTTIVIGAGSSCELRLPSGAQLRSLIAHSLTRDPLQSWHFGDQRIRTAIETALQGTGSLAAERIGALVEAGDRIRAGMSVAASIDNYLHTHHDNPDVVLVGKCCIASAILTAERNSLLFEESQNNSRIHTDAVETIGKRELQEKSWLPDLARWIFTGADRAKPEQALANLRLIIFNYDRCVEQFLWLALQAYFGITEAEAAFLVGQADIVHPYGTVGLLPWQLGAPLFSHVAFGHDDSPRMFEISQNVKTFTESVNSSVSGEINRYISDSHLLVFMGYGFAEQNNELLRIKHGTYISRIFATAHGLSEADRDMQYIAIGSILGTSVGAWNDRSRAGIPAFLERGGCKSLMDNHYLQLTLR